VTELPRGWALAPLCELVAVEPHSLAIGPFGSNLKVSDYEAQGVPLIFVRNIRARDFDLVPTFVSEAKATELSAHHVAQGDVLITKMGDPPGDTAVYPVGRPTAVLTADCIKATPHPDLSGSYIALAIEGPSCAAQIADMTSGVAQQKVSLAKIRGLSIPVAPHAEQERIVAAIEEAFSKLDAGEAGLRTVRRLLKRIRDAILAAAVTGRLVPQDPTDTPATKLLADLGIEPLDTERGDIPDGWASLGLENALAHTIGGVWGAEHGADEIDVSVLRVTEMRADGSLDPSSAVVRSITARQLETRRLEPGDLLLEKSGGGPTRPVGRVGLVRRVADPSVCANFMQLLRPDRRLCVPEYLEIALRQLHSSGGTEPLQTASTNIRNLKMKDYFSLPVLLPPISEQARIVTELERQMSFVDACERAVGAGLERSAGLRRSVLKAAFEGQLVPQDPTDEPASVLLERIRAERAATPKAKTRRAKAKS
jgi:type I restriction enzyme, S subunit